MVLTRDVHGATDVAALGSLPAGVTPATIVFSTRDLDQPFAGGAKVLVGHTFADSPLQAEFSFFSLAPWESEAAIRDNTPNALGGAGNLLSVFTNFGSPAGVAGVDYNNLVSIRNYSTLDNGELNFVWLLPTPPGRLTSSVLLGARYMKVREQFNYFSQSDVPLLLGATNAVTTRTRNEIWGPQIGAIGRVYIEDHWWIDFTIKGAICNNAASQDTAYTNVNNGVSQTFLHDRSRNVTVYAGDLDLTLVYRWDPHVATRVGYQAIWVQGLALASENFARPLEFLALGPSWLEHSGQTVYHGVHAGVEFTW